MFSTRRTGSAERGARRAAARPRSLQLLTDHVADKPRAVEIGRRRGHHHAPVAQHRDAVGVAQRLLQRMRDEDHRHAVAAQGPHQVEQMVGLLRRERGGRLIEDDDARLVEHGARDLHHLPLRRRQRAGKLRGIDLEVQPLQHLPGGVANLAHRVEGALPAEHDVLRHGELRHQAGLLVDHRDAEAAGVLRRGEGGDAVRRRTAHPAKVRRRPPPICRASICRHRSRPPAHGSRRDTGRNRHRQAPRCRRRSW